MFVQLTSKKSTGTVGGFQYRLVPTVAPPTAVVTQGRDYGVSSRRLTQAKNGTILAVVVARWSDGVAAGGGLWI